MNFDELKNYAISDILSVNGKDKAARIAKNHMDNLIEVALIKGAQSRQAEIDELQNRIDDVVKKLESIKTDGIRPHCYDYDKGWRDCAITVLSDLKGKENEH